MVLVLGKFVDCVSAASEVGGMLAEVCRRCMVVMDTDCISSLCMLQKQRIEVDISVPATTDVEHHGMLRFGVRYVR